MLNIFPELLNYGLLAPTIIRITLAITLLFIGYETVFSKRLNFLSYFEAKKYPLAKLLPIKLGVAEIIAGLFLLFGFFTQVAALATVFLSLMLMYIENRDEKILPHSLTFYLIIAILSVTLLFSGAGAFAIDIPL